MATLQEMADQLAEDMAKLGDMTDDDMLWDLSHRSVFSAWLMTMRLEVSNATTPSKITGSTPAASR